MKRIKSLAWIFAVIMAIGPLLSTGCGILNPPHRDKRGYYTAHYSCCGPTALGIAFDKIYARDHVIRPAVVRPVGEISRVIQDAGQKHKTFLSFFNRNAVCITWPSEIKAAAEHYGFSSITLDEMSELNPEKDVAVILVHGSTLRGEWHWVCFPFYDIESIEKWYGEGTKVEKIYLLKFNS